MITIEEITKNYHYVDPFFGNSGNFQTEYYFPEQTGFCDVYFRAPGKKVEQHQVDAFNQFISNYSIYEDAINRYILSNLKFFETNSLSKIQRVKIHFDVIDVPLETNKYDLVLVLSKEYRWLLFKRNLGFRVEFKNGKIQSINRCRDCTEDNK